MAKTTVKKAAAKAARKRSSAKKAQPQPPRNRREAEAFIERYGLADLAPKAARALRRAFTE